MAKKQALTLQNLQDGEFIAQVNEAIAQANTAVGASDNPKAKAEITIKIAIEISDSSRDFRTVTPSLVIKSPALPKRATVYAVNFIDGERVIAVDPAQDGDQMKMPGVADIGSKRAAS